MPAAMAKMSAGMYAGSSAVDGNNQQAQKQVDEVTDILRVSVDKMLETRALS